LSSGNNENMISIGGANQEVILRDLTLKGSNSNNASLVRIDNGTFTMQSGTITGNTTSSRGGGV
jgi:hypothetical protein